MTTNISREQKIFIMCVAIILASMLTVGAIFLLFFNNSTQKSEQPIAHFNELFTKTPNATPVVAIPQERNTMFEVQWSGGSLYQLKANLATQGCIVNNIRLTQNNTTYWYSQYDLPSTDPARKAFLEQYSEFIPASTIQVSCYAVCDFAYTGTQQEPCVSAEEVTIANAKVNFGAMLYTGAIPREPSDELLESLYQCTTEWSPIVQQKVLPLLPVPDNVCVFRFDGFVADSISSALGVAGLFVGFPPEYMDMLSAVQHLMETNAESLYALYEQIGNTTNFLYSDSSELIEQIRQTTGVDLSYLTFAPNIQPYIVLFISSDRDIPQEQIDTYNLHLEIHELCHANQYWQITASLEQDNKKVTPIFRYMNPDSLEQLREILGAHLQQEVNDNGEVVYSLRQDSVYRELYHTGISDYDTISELGAELCALYILDTIGEDPYYAYGSFILGVYTKLSKKEFDVNQYLTPEVRQWVEQYVIGATVQSL